MFYRLGNILDQQASDQYELLFSLYILFYVAVNVFIMDFVVSSRISYSWGRSNLSWSRKVGRNDNKFYN